MGICDTFKLQVRGSVSHFVNWLVSQLSIIEKEMGRQRRYNEQQKLWIEYPFVNFKTR